MDVACIGFAWYVYRICFGTLFVNATVVSKDGVDLTIGLVALNFILWSVTASNVKDGKATVQRPLSQ